MWKKHLKGSKAESLNFRVKPPTEKVWFPAAPNPSEKGSALKQKNLGVHSLFLEQTYFQNGDKTILIGVVDSRSVSFTLV